MIARPSFHRLYQHVIIFTACLSSTLVVRVSSDIFTSSKRVERLLNGELLLLSTLQQYITDQHTQLPVITSHADLEIYRQLKSLSVFHDEQLRILQKRDIRRSKEDIKHPNGFYKAIQRLAMNYIQHLGTHYDHFKEIVQQTLGGFAEKSDVEGAKESLLRLQKVYHLLPMDMARGDYLGYKGPQLDIQDMFQIASIAFSSGRFNESLMWLQAAYEMSHSSLSPPDQTHLADILALMGRAYVFSGDDDTAHQLYRRAAAVGSLSVEVGQLQQELMTKPRAPHAVDQGHFANFSRLCRINKTLNTPFHSKPRIVCRYREVLLPYHRFKEEILSEAPFVSVMYDVITDEENRFVRNFTSNKLVRATVGVEVYQTVKRISDTAWIYDWDDPKARRISQRVKELTGLETQQRAEDDGPSSGEPFQVVNYGLGGHYEVHVDQFMDGDRSGMNGYVRNSGDRIATFLIYLTDVERGGATVFNRAGISVLPVKNMALFWYGYKPSMEADELTEHAGCPVLIGTKWIVNKWIWTYGNTLTRRCGLTPDATQLDIEKDMEDHYGAR